MAVKMERENYMTKLAPTRLNVEKIHTIKPLLMAKRYKKHT